MAQAAAGRLGVTRIAVVALISTALVLTILETRVRLGREHRRGCNLAQGIMQAVAGHDSPL